MIVTTRRRRKTINAQDKFGSTLYHVVAQGNHSAQHNSAISILLENAVNPLIKDHREMLALDKITMWDPRRAPLQHAMHKYRHIRLQNLTNLDTFRNILRNGIQEFGLEGSTLKDGQRDSCYKDMSSSKPPSCGSECETLIKTRLETRAGSSKPSVFMEEVNAARSMGNQEAMTSSLNSTPQTKEWTPNELLRDDVSEVKTKAATLKARSFEDLPWKVECSAEVMKVLHDKNLPESTKQQIFEKLQQLAEGCRSARLSKKLHHFKSKSGSCLFEARLTQGARIIWQKATVFSSQYTETHRRSVPGNANFKIYAQVIRIWSIVFQHDHVDRAIKKIRKSLELGKVSSVGFRNTQEKQASSKNSSTVYPKLYLEGNDSAQHHYPIVQPVECSGDKDYSIIKKFYSMTSYMIRNVLSGIQDVDYPFEVTELEHEIINLKPSPECSIILLGRSGTGKTTCCLYRLWSDYHVYQHAALIAKPHMTPQRSATVQGLDDPACSASSADSGQVATPGSVRVDETTQPANGCSSHQDEASDLNEQEISEWEDFHQIFISRNGILCEEVARMFHCLRNACYPRKADVPVLPVRLQDVSEDSWPLFLSVLQWLTLLDASLPGEPFFPRGHNGQLLCSVRGMDHEIRTSLSSCWSGKTEDQTAFAKTRAASETDKGPVYTMISYEAFATILWPKMVRKTKKQSTLHPNLVWTEIMSFIKGSVDALESGELSLEDYEQVGRKMAPNFRGNRAIVYELYRKYKDLKKSLSMFDECDLVYNVYKRLQQAPVSLLPLHRFYVDEAQDLTKAELFLLIHCCRDPNGLFFSGDTAQSIMKGVSFRFADLKALFFRESQQRPVNVPDRIYQLTCNYRSHSGIVRLASSVVELLQHFFPESLDRIAKEQGLFPGPKPVLIESCAFDDLARLLKRQQSGNGPIELGAQQVVLVATDKARDSVPEELKQGLVMTIYEAKGLEFDDVLIFNFFKDSEVCVVLIVLFVMGNYVFRPLYLLTNYYPVN